MCYGDGIPYFISNDTHTNIRAYSRSFAVNNDTIYTPYRHESGRVMRMATLIEFEVMEFPAARVIGRQVTVSMKEGAANPVPAMWTAMTEEGTLAFLKESLGRLTPEPDMVGWMGDYNPETNEFIYIAGVLSTPDAPVPAGFYHRDIQPCSMGVGWIQGSDDGGDLYQGAHDHTAKAMRENGYEYYYPAGGFEMEYYSHVRFVLPMERGEKTLVMGYYSPCRKMEHADADK